MDVAYYFDVEEGSEGKTLAANLAYNGLHVYEGYSQGPLFVRLAPGDAWGKPGPLVNDSNPWLKANICRFTYCQVVSINDGKKGRRYHLRFFHVIRQEGNDSQTLQEERYVTILLRRSDEHMLSS